jgi:hypothetical protein
MTLTSTSVVKKVMAVITKKTQEEVVETKEQESQVTLPGSTLSAPRPPAQTAQATTTNDDDTVKPVSDASGSGEGAFNEETVPDSLRELVDPSDRDSIFLGLKVYTKKEVPVTITGQLRHEMEISAKLALS